MSFDRINRINRMFYKALDATENPLVFSHLSLYTKSRLLLDFSRGAQRVSPVCCVLLLWFRWGGCEKVDPYPHGRDGHAPLFRCKVQFQRDNGISSILFILLIDSICSPFGQTSFVDLRFSPSLSKIRFRVHCTIAWILDFRFPRRGSSPT